MKLNSWENSKIVYASNGNTSYIRDAVKPLMVDQPTVIEEITPEIEVVMSGEPSLEIINEELPIEETLVKKIKTKK